MHDVINLCNTLSNSIVLWPEHDNCILEDTSIDLYLQDHP